MKFNCPVCGFNTLSQAASLSKEMCPVCGWVQNPYQFNDRQLSGAPNFISLNEAQINFRRTRASQPKALSLVRAPLPEEYPVAASYSGS